MTSIREDVRHALRRLRSRPWFTVTAILILALGVTSSGAVFTYLNNFYRPLPGVDTDGLARVYLATNDDPYRALSYPDYLDLARDADDIGGVAATYSGFGASVRFESLAEVAFGEAATGEYFRLLDVHVPLGRALTPADDRPGAEPAVLLSHAYWLSRYGGEASAIGQTILLNGEPYTIVGVTPPDFLGLSSSRRPQFWLPFEQYKRVYWARSDRETDREAAAVSVVVRLAGASESATQALAALGSSLDAQHRLDTGPRRFRLEAATWIEPSARVSELPTVHLWLAAAAGLLLLACANVANLVLSASLRRGPEMALRAALGADSGRLLKQLLTESLVLSGIAGGVAVTLVGPLSRRFGSYFARPSVWGTNVPRVIDVDGRVLVFLLAVSVVTGVLAGIVPAWRGSHRDLAKALRDETRSMGEDAPGWGRLWFGVREALVSSQIALSLVLLVVAGLVLRTLDKSRSVETGFDTRTTIATYVSTSSIGTPVEERHRFYDDLVDRFRALPWVRSATVTDFAPLSPHAVLTVRSDDVDQPFAALQAMVGPGYFEALDIGLVDGRPFTREDSLGTEPVTIVGETLARRAFGPERAVGRQLWLPIEGDDDGAGGAAASGTTDQSGGAERGLRIVGVVEDARLESLIGGPELVAYLPLSQHYSAPGNSLLVSVRGDPREAVAMVEQELRSAHPMIAIVNVLPYRDVVGGYLYQQRMNAELFTLVAFLGSVLACGGVFAIMSLTVSMRHRELGIRRALGASHLEIVGAVGRKVAVSTGVGLAVGLIVALLAGRWVASLLYAVQPTDAVVIAAAVVLLSVAALLAAWMPTRRALQLDPVASLRAG